ncbi:MAG: hypothetical protein CMN63_01470 [Sphingobium sp.]|nr:hypothetical protein [Sphingobium sp.]|tara:strand:+ start:2009 stop:2572 length:564 start_codon:yes stop_codon:yes gene_type:complete
MPMAQYTETLHTVDHIGGGNVLVRPYGARRIAATMAIATFTMSFPSHAAANDAFAPMLPTDNSKSQATLAAVERRFAALCEIADDEGIVINRSSYISLKNFVRNWTGARPPAIMLMEDGTVRAVWRDAKEQQVALHFRDNGKVQYVIFLTGDDGNIERATGLSSLSGIASKLLAFGAKGLLAYAAVA